jgi:exodeoxyribonuclease V alpha subunit
MLNEIKQLRNFDIFSDLDVHFSTFITNLSDNKEEELLLGAVLASYFTSLGSSCVDLKRLADDKFFPLQSEAGIKKLSCPNLSQWLATLQKSSVVGKPGDYTPLILDKHRLYLYRYWDYEKQLAAQILARCYQQRTDIKHNILETGLSRLFPVETDLQKSAAQTAVLRNFCIISGGPGTGKTSTVIKIIALLLEQNPNLRIALAAPTGKAAARLQEAIRQGLHNANIQMPQETYTIHRLLGNNSHSFNNHIDNRLLYDVVIIDEASMVDLALMAKLAQSIPKSSRWILLGDKDQLASVEAGTVLGDICEATVLQQNVIFLEKNYRFGEQSGIWTLAQAVKQGKSDKALSILKSKNYPFVNWHSISSSDHLPVPIIEQIIQNFSSYLQEKQPDKLLAVFDQKRILCAMRKGPYGVEAVNHKIEDELRRKGLIRTNHRWYHGCPIMITRNDYQLQLFNGDVGIILKGDNYKLQAFFPSPDGKIRVFWPNRLPEHETVYAMTIHKSQGSEFDQVLILLPDQFSPVLSRELIYTGITRAKKRVSIWGDEQVFKAAVLQKIARSSGLREQLSIINRSKN